MQIQSGRTVPLNGAPNGSRNFLRGKYEEHLFYIDDEKDKKSPGYTGVQRFVVKVEIIAEYGIQLQRFHDACLLSMKNLQNINVLRIRDVYSGSRIQKQQQKRGVEKKLVVIPFYVATNFTKLKIILVLKC